MSAILETKLIVTTPKGTRVKVPATMEFNDGRIYFIKSPFALKDEIKAMKGSKWHGFDEDEPRKIWSIEDCPRNRFQLDYLMGNNPYEWFDRDLIQHEYERPLKAHQKYMADSGLTYHFNIWGAEMGVGKTLSAIEVIEKSGVQHWWYVAPKKVLEAIKREFKKWKLDPRITVELLTYEGMTTKMDKWSSDQPIPQGVIFDESSRLKTAGVNRTTAAQMLADLIRKQYGHDGYVILMSGTPSPKSPVDWWAQAEIAYPGFLREGSEKAFRTRLAFLQKRDFGAGGVHNDLIGWRDDQCKCNICGEHESAHDFSYDEEGKNHQFAPSVNEVALMYERLKGLVVILHKKDCLDLPDKQYRRVYCKPSPSTLRVAQALVNSAVNTVTGMTLLRELSDGFQYREVQEGTVACSHCPNAAGKVDEWFDPADPDRTYSGIDMLNPDLVAKLEKHEVDCPVCEGSGEMPKMVRYTREVPCPKEDALKELLEENEEHGRAVIFGGFTGSVDRIVNICLKEEWHVVRCDGRGFQVSFKDSDGTITVLRKADALDYWADLENNSRVAFVAHPESGGLGLTLTEACMAIFYSNSFKPEYRTQSEDRIHREGMDQNRGAIIVDLIHLPTDERCLDVIRANRKLELMSMGEVMQDVKWEYSEAA